MSTIKSLTPFENSHNIVGSFSAGSLTTNTPVNFDWSSNNYSSNSTCVGSECTAQNNRSLIVGGRKKNNISHNNMSRRITFKKSYRRTGKSRRYKYTPAPNTRRIVRKYKYSGTRCKKNCRRHAHTRRMRGGGCGCSSPSLFTGGATNKMRGGKSAFDGSLPLSFGYGLDGVRLGTDLSALASPIPFKPYVTCSK